MRISDLNHFEEITDSTDVIGGTGCYSKYVKYPKIDLEDILADIDDLVEKYKEEAEKKVAAARKKVEVVKKKAKAEKGKAAGASIKTYSKGDGYNAVKVSVSVIKH